jgi:hypothetical protein
MKKQLNKKIEKTKPAHLSNAYLATKPEQVFSDFRPEAKSTMQIQKKADQRPKSQPIAQMQHNALESNQRAISNAGIPQPLKSGIESLSGHAMDDVKVHYNSSKPAQMQAHAYAQGNQIHLGPGQEKHLPHEAWHVVQQKQGRVQTTHQFKSKVNINDNPALEGEADLMGSKAMEITQRKSSSGHPPGCGCSQCGGKIQRKTISSNTIQRVKEKKKPSTVLYADQHGGIHDTTAPFYVDHMGVSHNKPQQDQAAKEKVQYGDASGVIHSLPKGVQTPDVIYMDPQGKGHTELGESSVTDRVHAEKKKREWDQMSELTKTHLKITKGVNRDNWWKNDPANNTPTIPVRKTKEFTPAEMEARAKARPSIRQFIGEQAENVIMILDEASTSYGTVFYNHPEIINDYYKRFNASQFAQVVTRILLEVPNRVVNPEASRTEAIRLLSAELANKDVAKRMLENRTRIYIVPLDTPMTDLPAFAKQKGVTIEEQSAEKRTWDTTRGLGGKKTAITEENLLGMKAEVGEEYCHGYSTTTHEFAHAMHFNGLSNEDKALITKAYNAKKAHGKEEEWTDGRRYKKGDASKKLMENYASSTEAEYFAQAVNAWFGTNTGTDSYTQWPRQNGKAWVMAHEPILKDLLQRVLPKNPPDLKANQSESLLGAMRNRARKFRVIYENED